MQSLPGILKSQVCFPELYKLGVEAHGYNPSMETRLGRPFMVA